MENENKEQVEQTPIEVTVETPEPVIVQADNAEVLAELKALKEQFAASQQATQPEVKGTYQVNTAPNVMPKSGLGDSQAKAFDAWMRYGDTGAVSSMITGNEGGREVVSIKASNATDMNIGTAADGGNTVSDDMYNRIVRRRDESWLGPKVGVTSIQGHDNVIDIPFDNEADSEFVAANEAAQFDNDAPAIGQKVITKSKYTKRTLVSYELLQDTRADLLSYVTDRVAIGYGKTLNDLIINEVEANGTEYDVLAGTASIAVDELEITALNATNAFYVEDPSRAAWVMAPATYKAIQILDDANVRRYTQNTQGGQSGSSRELLGSPVHFSSKCEAIGSGLKPYLFGDWSYMFLYEDPSLQFMRDPYTRADYGQVRLIWYFRAAAGLVQTAALGYARNITT